MSTLPGMHTSSREDTVLFPGLPFSLTITPWLQSSRRYLSVLSLSQFIALLPLFNKMEIIPSPHKSFANLSAKMREEHNEQEDTFLYYL